MRTNRTTIEHRRQALKLGAKEVAFIALQHIALGRSTTTPV
jgi:hypothetical protein